MGGLPSFPHSRIPHSLCTPPSLLHHLKRRHTLLEVRIVAIEVVKLRRDVLNAVIARGIHEPVDDTVDLQAAGVLVRDLDAEGIAAGYQRGLVLDYRERRGERILTLYLRYLELSPDASDRKYVESYLAIARKKEAQ